MTSTRREQMLRPPCSTGDQVPQETFDLVQGATDEACVDSGRAGRQAVLLYAQHLKRRLHVIDL
jgi:hypothetical protein